MPVRIVTDSACDLTAAEAAALGVEVVPLSVRFGAEELVDGVELTVEDFYSRMAATPDLPQTAAPAPGAFEAAYRRCLEGGADAVVCINLSAQLSATMQSAQNGARAVADADIRCVDSKSVTSGLGTMVRWAATRAAEGASADEIVAGVEEQASRTRVLATLDTLDNLKKGGRIGGAKALLGSLLSVKPAIAIVDGVVEEAGKPRTRTKALQWLADRVLAEPALTELHVMHAQAPDVDAFVALLAPKYAPSDITVGLIGPIIGAHGGPRLVGVTYQVAPGA